MGLDESNRFNEMQGVKDDGCQNDENAVFSQADFFVSFAFSLPLGPTYRLSVGLWWIPHEKSERELYRLIHRFWLVGSAAVGPHVIALTRDWGNLGGARSPFARIPSPND
jgi:hypothetical protein